MDPSHSARGSVSSHSTRGSVSCTSTSILDYTNMLLASLHDHSLGVDGVNQRYTNMFLATTNDIVAFHNCGLSVDDVHQIKQLLPSLVKYYDISKQGVQNRAHSAAAYLLVGKYKKNVASETECIKLFRHLRYRVRMDFLANWLVLELHFRWGHGSVQMFSEEDHKDYARLGPYMNLLWRTFPRPPLGIHGYRKPIHFIAWHALQEGVEVPTLALKLQEISLPAWAVHPEEKWLTTFERTRVILGEVTGDCARLHL